MREMPLIPASAPFTAEQRAWLNGYLAGLFVQLTGAEASPASVVSESAGASSKAPLLILYGSQTGTAEQLARKIGSEAGSHGFAAEVAEMNAYASVDLASTKTLLCITSTWGDGDPPDNAVAFFGRLNSPSHPRLNHLSYAVLGLGDRNYANFCGAGKALDSRMEQLGARRIAALGECDVDYHATAQGWVQSLWPALNSNTAPAEVITAPETTSASSPDAPAAPNFVPTDEPRFNRNRPFPSRLLANRVLNRAGSAKETRHFELSLAGSELDYEVGDALGVWPKNCPELVNGMLSLLGWSGLEPVSIGAEKMDARTALLEKVQLTPLHPDAVNLAARSTGHPRLQSLCDPAQRPLLEDYLRGRDLLDLLSDFPEFRPNPSDLIGVLRKLQPRLYSIASSPKAHPGEVHLTVSIVRYEAHARRRNGVCSAFLADRAGDAPVPVFLHRSPGFRLPRDGAVPILMIGPGTGIAPFRAFLEERRATAAPGPNWLFFGDQCAATDFLYEEELLAWQRSGFLTRLDTAFSRDQKEKVYVQHRLLEHAAEVWRWIEDGAHIYVCGDAKRMARDVDEALQRIVAVEGNKSAEAAAAFLQELKSAKRYQRDVY